MLTSLACLIIGATLPAGGTEPLVLRGADGVELVFEGRNGKLRWAEYRDTNAGRQWPVAGPLFSLQTEDGFRANLGDLGCDLSPETPPTADTVTLEATVTRPPVHIRQCFSFCPDGRTFRIRTSLRAPGDPLVIQRVGLLEVRLPGQALQLKGPGHVSSPVVGDRIYAGVEHPAALCQVDGDTMYLAQHSYTPVGTEWVEVPSVILGAASEADMAAGSEGVRRAFLRYLDTVRVRPRDMHVHYNNWWTMPVPFTEQDVLANIAALRAGLYETTGFFFDSYAMDMGWSDPHTVWEVNRQGYPQGLRRIRDALAPMGCRLGLWVSPSSLYPPALDNAWLEQNGYEVSPGSYLGKFACLALGGRYQRAFKSALLRHARSARLGHVKFDGLAWPCTAEDHRHRPGLESFQPIAEGLADVMDALRQVNPDIALEPTCLGYYPSPWWLMHTPFVIGPFGDDSPRGVCPAPEWIEAMTTGRDVANLRGRDAFWMPTSALECFDIVVQCPGDMRNHAVMAIARGHWFQSTYINPRFMDEAQWRFFADLMRWARQHRQQLVDPVVFGGDPAQRQAYGYAFLEGERQFYFVRNPWIEPTTIALPEPPGGGARELRTLYPCRSLIARTRVGAPLPEVCLGPYELLVLEAVPTARRAQSIVAPAAPPVAWSRTHGPTCERLVYPADPPAYGPSWSAPEGDAEQALVLSGGGRLSLRAPAELCVLAETSPGAVPATCAVTVGDRPLVLRETGTRGAFSATGTPPVEEWQWFLARLPRGQHRLSYRLVLPDESTRCGMFVRGTWPARGDRQPQASPAFPLPANPGRAWSHTLLPVSPLTDLGISQRQTERMLIHINGVYLDSLQWTEATAGWGEVHRNASVMGLPMTMGGRLFRRGLGTHAYSRISFLVPPGHTRFAATIGCDQEVFANTIVFVVQGDGRELFRSGLMRRDTPPLDINVPIRGVRTLTLIVEDGGDGITADHGNWADARILR